MKAARQARWRKNAAIKQAVVDNVDHSMGLSDRPAPPMPDIPQRDIARTMRDRFHAIIDGLSDDDLMDKDLAPSLTLALKTQKVLDDREKVKARQGTPELGWRILEMLAGRALPPRLLDDGRTIEGTAVELPQD